MSHVTPSSAAVREENPTLGSFLLPQGFARPGVLDILHETRVVLEAGRWAAGSLREVRRTTPTTDPGLRHRLAAEPVLLVPGFMAGDSSLSAMSRALRARRVRTYRAHIRANVGCTQDAVAELEARVESIALKREHRVRIVGHSLGGMLARGLAARRPDLVSGIVTLGSPVLAPGAHHVLLTAGVDVLIGLSRAGVRGLMSQDCVAGACARRSFEESHAPLRSDVSYTAVYSKRDGVVDWRACAEPTARPVEVTCSHLGMAIDPRVVQVVTDALLRPAYAARTRDRETDGAADLPGRTWLRSRSVLEVDRGESA